MRYISHSKARQLAYSWHGGQFSPLYAFASSGIVQNLDALKREVQSCLNIQFSDYREEEHGLNQKECIELYQLQRYIDNRLIIDPLFDDKEKPMQYLAQWFYDRNIGF